jgi:hypothetical protein
MNGRMHVKLQPVDSPFLLLLLLRKLAYAKRLKYMPTPYPLNKNTAGPLRTYGSVVVVIRGNLSLSAFKKIELTGRRFLKLCRSMNTASKLGPHTQTGRGRCPVWGSEFTSKDAAQKGGMMVVLMPLFAAALVVSRRYFIVAPKPFPAAPLVVRCMYMAVVPGPMPATVASRCCRRRSQRSVCACGS